MDIEKFYKTIKEISEEMFKEIIFYGESYVKIDKDSVKTLSRKEIDELKKKKI